MTLTAHPFLLLAMVTTQACVGAATPPATSELSEDPSDTVESPLELRSELVRCCGSYRTLVEGIAAAENLLFTSDDRLLVTGTEAIYELRRDAARQFHAAVLLQGDGACMFTGIAELNGAVYATCSDYASSTLFAARLIASMTFKRVTTLSNVVLANGLAADADSHLYVAEMLQGQIERLTIAAADPFMIAGREPWLVGTGLFTDGLKVFDSTLYWTDFGTIKRAAIRARGEAGPIRTLVSAVTFIDDLYVSEQGILAADFLGGAIRGFDLRGLPNSQTPAELTNPSAVVPAQGRLGFSDEDLVITDRGANRVVVYSTSR